MVAFLIVPVLVELRLVVAFKARRHKKIYGMEDKKEASSSGSSYLVGWLLQFLFGWLIWLVVAFKASHKRICGMEGKEKASNSGSSYLVGWLLQFLIGWLVVAVLI